MLINLFYIAKLSIKKSMNKI